MGLTEPTLPGNALEGIEAEVAGLLAARKPSPPAELRAHEFHRVIAPKLRRMGYQPEHIRDLTDWGCEPQRKSFEYVRGLLAARGAIVALVGIRGSGKTMLSAQIAAAWAWDDYRSAQAIGQPTSYRDTPYRKLTDLLAIYKALYADFGSADPEKLAARRDTFCAMNDLITIDEVGECDELKTRERLLTDFIDRIYAAGNRALLISNQTQDAFAASVGALQGLGDAARDAVPQEFQI